MTSTSRKPIFIQDQQLSRLVLLPEDRGDKLKYLRAQHGGEAWEPGSQFEKFTKEQNRNYPRWQKVKNRWELFSQFQSRKRVLLTVTAYAGIGKSMVLHQIDGLLPFAREGIDIVRVEFSSLPDDWEQYIHKPWKGDKPFLVRILSDEFSRQRKLGYQLPQIDSDSLRRWVEAKIRTGNFVLAIDSLDEYNAPDAEEKARQLRHILFEVFPTLHCIVAGRPHAITQELWLSLFSDLYETNNHSPRSDWEFLRVEMFDRKQLERFLGKEMADQLKTLEADIEFSPRNLEVLRTLDEATRASIRSTADLYWHSIVNSLPSDNREGMGKKLIHTSLKVEEILHMLSAIGITMALWYDDPRFPVDLHQGLGEHELNNQVSGPDTGDISNHVHHPKHGAMQLGEEYAQSFEGFRRDLYFRLLELHPPPWTDDSDAPWQDNTAASRRPLYELRFDELTALGRRYVETSFLREIDPDQPRFSNETQRDFLAALRMFSPGEMQVGGENSPPIEEFRRRLFSRLLEVYPTWHEIAPPFQRRLIELRFEELIALNTQFVEFGFFKERDPNQLRWRNENQRDFFAALWMSTRANAIERDAYQKRVDKALLSQDSSIARTWQMICGMPVDSRRLCDGADQSAQNLAWLRMIAPLYKSQKEERCYRGRPTELMYRAWAGLLMRAGILRGPNWLEYDLMVASTIAQRCFDRKTIENEVPTKVSIKDVNAWKIVGSFLTEFPRLRDQKDEKSEVIAEDLENWCNCNSRAGMKIRVGHAEEEDNVERDIELECEFSLSAFQVTKRLYSLFDSSYVVEIKPRRENHQSVDPRCAANYLSWFDSMMFCIWCHGYLPSEWEWEYGSRAGCIDKEGANSRYYWGDGQMQLWMHGWTGAKYDYHSVERVGLRTPNIFGLFDTLGNVWEWCRNHYLSERSAWKDKLETKGVSHAARVLRGGSYADIAKASCSYRENRTPSDANRDSGCRVFRVHSFGQRHE